jgi:hypothetical protein
MVRPPAASTTVATCCTCTRVDPSLSRAVTNRVGLWDGIDLQDVAYGNGTLTYDAASGRLSLTQDGAVPPAASTTVATCCTCTRVDPSLSRAVTNRVPTGAASIGFGLWDGIDLQDVAYGNGTLTYDAASGRLSLTQASISSVCAPVPKVIAPVPAPVALPSTRVVEPFSQVPPAHDANLVVTLLPNLSPTLDSDVAYNLTPLTITGAGGLEKVIAPVPAPVALPSTRVVEPFSQVPPA